MLQVPAVPASPMHPVQQRPGRFRFHEGSEMIVADRDPEGSQRGSRQSLRGNGWELLIIGKKFLVLMTSVSQLLTSKV